MVLAVIPARFASTRLPGKAIADIGGTPMVVRVWERVCRAPGIDRVLIATDHDRIAEICVAAGAEVARTGECASGTDRVAEAARGSGADVVVNVQGDEPFIHAEDIGRVAAGVSEFWPIVTGGRPLPAGEAGDPARVKVACAPDGRALYFSRAPIPYGGPYRLHVGIYAFTASALADVAELPPSPLERAERLEQLRWLEARYRIRVVPVLHPSLSVDTPEDLEAARAQVHGVANLSPRR